MKLHYAPQSPFARRARVAAAELGLETQIELEYVEAIPGRPNSAFSETTNPLKRIPALTLEDGEVIVDSTVICEYFDSIAGGGRLVPKGGNGRWRVLSAASIAHGMCESAVQVRYETALRPEPARWFDWVEDHWRKVDSGLDWFEARPTILAEPLDLSHITLGCLLGYLDFRWPNRDWRTGRTKLRDWYTRIERRDSFEKTKPANPQNR